MVRRMSPPRTGPAERQQDWSYPAIAARGSELHVDCETSRRRAQELRRFMAELHPPTQAPPPLRGGPPPADADPPADRRPAGSHDEIHSLAPNPFVLTPSAIPDRRRIRCRCSRVVRK